MEQYTLPGVMHFLRTEWQQRERARIEWEIERAELRTRLSRAEKENHRLLGERDALQRHLDAVTAELRRRAHISDSEAGETAKTGENGETEAKTAETEANQDTNETDEESLVTSVAQSREFLHQCLTDIRSVLLQSGVPMDYYTDVRLPKQVSTEFPHVSTFANFGPAARAVALISNSRLIAGTPLGDLVMWERDGDARRFGRLPGLKCMAYHNDTLYVAGGQTLALFDVQFFPKPLEAVDIVNESENSEDDVGSASSATSESATSDSAASEGSNNDNANENGESSVAAAAAAAAGSNLPSGSASASASPFGSIGRLSVRSVGSVRSFSDDRGRKKLLTSLGPEIANFALSPRSDVAAFVLTDGSTRICVLREAHPAGDPQARVVKRMQSVEACSLCTFVEVEDQPFVLFVRNNPTDSQLLLVNPVDGRQQRKLTVAVVGLSSVLATPDVVFTGTDRGDIRAISLHSGETLAEAVAGHCARITSLSLSGGTLIATCADGRVSLWSLPTLAWRGRLMSHDGAFGALSSFATSNAVAVGGGDGLVRVYRRSRRDE